MGFEIADLRGVGADFKGQLVVYLEAGDNPITAEEWATYEPDPGFMLNTPRAGKFDVLNVLGSPYQPTGVYTYLTDSKGFTWQAVAAVENRIYPFDASDYAGYNPPLTSSAQAGFLIPTPLPGTIQYNNNDKNHENVYYAKDSSGAAQLQYFVGDPWGNVYILKSVNLANDTPEGIAAAVAAAVLPEGWAKWSGYLPKDTSYMPAYSGSVAHANEFRDSADSAWMQIVWGKSGTTLAVVIGDGLEIWGGNDSDILKGTLDDDVMHGGAGNDQILGRKGSDTITGDAGNDVLKGQAGRDSLFGGDGKDKLYGGRGADLLYGGAGNDRLEGGRGKDVLHGGAGNDKLKGGRGADVFAFDDLAMGRDRILDFGRGRDKIDLSAIDANVATPEDDPFIFIGWARFSGEAGELRYRKVGADVIVRGDVDGDGKGDFAIRLVDSRNLFESDFVL